MLSTHDLISEAARSAAALRAYRIKPYDATFALWKDRGGGDWVRIGMFRQREEAEAYLFEKLEPVRDTGPS
jgi:hypothetical protein